MLKGFEGYYPPDFTQLWNDAIFVPDANILLNLYRYSPQSRSEFLGILDQLGQRLWIPHQFFLEYHRNKLTISDSVSDKYSKWKRELLSARDAARNKTAKVLQEFSSRTRFDMELEDDWLVEKFDVIAERMDKYKHEHERSLSEQSLESRIAQLFDKKYGEPFDDVRLAEVRQLARERRENNIPPGSKKDDKKCQSDTDSDPDGDFLGWVQIKDFACKTAKPIIFITNDDDWFLSDNHKTKGPHYLLRQEIADEANVACYIYKWSGFIKYAREYIDAQISEEAVEEAEIRENYNSERESEIEHRGLTSRVNFSSMPARSDSLVSTHDIRKGLEPSRYESILNSISGPQQRLIDELTKPLREMQQRQIDELTKPLREMQQRQIDELTKPLREMQQRQIDELMKSILSG